MRLESEGVPLTLLPPVGQNKRESDVLQRGCGRGAKAAFGPSTIIALAYESPPASLRSSSPVASNSSRPTPIEP